MYKKLNFWVDTAHNLMPYWIHTDEAKKILNHNPPHSQGQKEVDMRTKINLKNKADIKALVRKTEMGCRARLLDTEDLPSITQRAEQKLANLNIPKKCWQGCQVHIEPEKPANSYRGIPHGTYAILERGSSDWFLVSVHRGMVNTQSRGGPQKERLILSQAAHDSIPISYEL